MNRFMTALLAAAIALSIDAQTLRTSGTLLVDVSADAITASDGEAIALWANGGSLGGAFAAITNNAGVSFTNSLLGKKAVLFNGSERNALTNAVATPSALTGTSAWSMEAWVWTASLPAAKSAYLSWTENTSVNTYEGSRLMFRYDTGGVSIDNLGSTVGFGYGTPAAGTWHHVAVVRNPFKQEKVFVDGNVVAFSWCQDSVQSGIPLSLGGVKLYTTTSYTNFFTGALSRVRVHTGMLSEEDVLHNFLADAPSYHASSSATWTGGTGNWNDAANWSNSVIGASAKEVHILSGAVSVTNNVAPSMLTSLDMVSGGLLLTDAAAQLNTKAPFVLGRDNAAPASLSLTRGSLSVSSAAGPAQLSLGMDGATSALTVGGGGGSASLYASRLHAYPNGSSSVYVLTNGLVELDSFEAETSANLSVTISGGTLRNKAGTTYGYFFDVPSAKVADGGLTFEAVAGSTMSVSAALLHDNAGPAKDGGISKTGTGTLTLSGTNSYTGPTSVEVGSLTLATRLTDGLVCRLDASSNALATLRFDATGTNVVAWTDANGSDLFFATNSLSEQGPVYDPTLFGGRGGLRFNRSEDVIRRLTANRSCRVQTLVLAMTPVVNSNLGGLWGQAHNDNGIRINSANTIQFCGNGNDFSSSGWVYTNGAIGCAVTLNQPLVATIMSGAPQNWTSAIGSYSQYRRHYRGDIGEMLLFDRKLDEAERRAVEQYLMAKWMGTVAAPDFTTPVLPVDTDLSIASGATLELGGAQTRVAKLSGFGDINNSNPTASTLTLGGLDASGIFAGAISGNVSVVKTGSGNVTLAGPNAYTGSTTIEAGTLTLMLATDVSSITGLVYRLDASRTDTMTFLPDGSNVTAWADAGGSDFTFATTNDVNCPAYDASLFNGRGGLRFGVSGARGRMLGSVVTNAQTVFAVNMTRDTSNDNGGFWGKNADDFGLRIGGSTWYWPGNNNDFHSGANGGLVYLNGVVSNAAVTANQRHLVTSVSGTRQTFKPAIGDYWGSSSWPSRYYRGDVAEILVYDRRLTDVERQTVEGVLMAKWFPSRIGAVLPDTASVRIFPGATLDLASGNGTLASLAGGGTVSNGTLTVTGTVAPDGTLTFTDGPTLTGTLSLDIAADGSGDSLSINGALDISGLTLDVNVPSTSPSVSSFTLISATGGITGTFASAPLSGAWRLVYEATAVRLTYASGTLIMLQ